MSEKVTSSTNFFLFLKKKNLHKVFNKQKKYNRSPHCAAAEPKFVHISSSEEVKQVVEGATHIYVETQMSLKSQKNQIDKLTKSSSTSKKSYDIIVSFVVMCVCRGNDRAIIITTTEIGESLHSFLHNLEQSLFCSNFGTCSNLLYVAFFVKSQHS